VTVHRRLGTPRVGAQVDDASEFIGHALQASVKAGPSVGIDLTRQCPIDFALGTRAKFDSNPLRGAASHPVADIVLVDDEVAVIIGEPTHQNMDVRIVGVPVVDGDPVEPGAEILLHVGKQFAGESPDIGELACIFGRDDKAEVVPVVGTAFGEGTAINRLVTAAKQFGILPVPGHPIALQVCQMSG